MKHTHLTSLFLIIVFVVTSDDSHAKPSPASSRIPNFIRTLNSTHPWKNFAQLQDTSNQFLLAGVLSFIAAAISSAGGIGGGGLFIPILTIVAGFDLKTASAYSAFMVTGGSIANVGSQFCTKRGGKPLIDYEIALLSEPCMLLGVSCGVICNLMFPEWLITVIFAVFLAFCTFKTCKSGVLIWKSESEGGRRNGCLTAENGGDGESTEMPLLDTGEVEEVKLEIPLLKLGMLLVIWFSFLILYLLRGNRYGQGIINIEACGTGYWIVSSIQVPLAIIFTIWILHCKKYPKSTSAAQQEREDEGTSQLFGELFFPVMTLLAGVLGGVFGIGGGMLISPLLLEVGIQPEVTAATCSFMVLFSSTMSAVQYLFLGMENVHGAVAYAAVCFSASLVGLTLVQRAIIKHGRASLIVFSVGTVMALSTVLITSFGTVNVWKDYSSGKNMGFKTPC